MDRNRVSTVGEMGVDWLCDAVVVYIEGYIFVFYILRKWGLSMSRFVLHSLRNQNKNKKKLTDGVGGCYLLFISFVSFLIEKKEYCINVVV